MSDAQSKMTHRETDIFTVAQLSQEFLRPERIRIQLNKDVKALPIDIGCFAYVERGRNKSHIDSRCNPVVEMSLFKDRLELIRRVIASFAIMGNHRTIHSECRYFAQLLTWCDTNNHTDVFSTASSTITAYQSYTQHLNHLIAVGEIVPVSACNFQRAFIRLIGLRFPEESRYIIGNAIRIRFNRGGVKPPREQHVEIYLKACVALARNLSEFVIGGNPFPCIVEYDNCQVVIFPSNKGVFSPYIERKLYVYNYSARRISTIEEYIDSLLGDGAYVRRSAVRRAVDGALDNFKSANCDPRHEQRLRLAALAAKAYACIFLVITGASPAEFVQFDYEEDTALEKSLVKKEFSAVKFRAGGKKTRYAIGKQNGLSLLREYLKLRAWILNGETFGKMFFNMNKCGGYTGGYTQLPQAFSSVFYKTISGIYLDPDCPNISSRAVRKFKSVVLHGLGLSPTTVADVMNHTVSTNVSDYVQTSIEQQESEFGSYWQSVRKAASVIRERRGADSFSTATGHCDDFNNPSPIDPVVVIQPSCKTQYGCLYCKHYVCHSDEEDLHKLFSLQFVINAVRSAAPDSHHADTLFKDLMIRIEFIIGVIGSRSATSAELSDLIRRKVNVLGELTPFWENRLQRYEKMGVVF
ncbi:hypothetical protein ACTXOX_24565 [Pseudomonas helleri]|uniref:hypothetical protein n=1 Tax=Pseudomonas helleri TaxID=1608996 RepID=UPI003FCF0082